nr:phage minor head protein [Rappaport israeli]
MKKSLTEALAQGQSFHSWKKQALTELATLDRRYVELVFRNATLSAHNSAKWAHFRDNAKRRPILRYSAVNDSRTRPSHSALHGLMMPVDDPRWQHLAPPNGHQCRCTLISLTERQAKAFGYNGAPTHLPEYTDKHGRQHTAHADNGWAHNPDLDLTALLREREQKAGLGRAMFDSGDNKANTDYSPNPEDVESIARHYVVSNGQKDGLEHGYLVDKHGAVIDIRSGRSEEIDYKDLSGRLAGATLYHNHPSNGILSRADIHFAREEKLASIVAFGTTENAYYKMQVHASETILYSWIYEIERYLRNHLFKMQKHYQIDKYEISMLYQYLLVIILNDHKIISYAHQPSVEMQAIFDKYSEQIEQLRRGFK